MAITWDSLLVAAVARSLDASLSGARLRALHLDRGDRTLVLWLREATVAVRLHPERGALTLHEPRDPPPEARPLQARLREVEAPPDDRILRLGFLKVRGRNPAVDVVLELMTNQWNALVTEGPARTVRHLLREREGGRPLRSGLPWTPPPPSGREGRDADLPLERWRTLLRDVEPRRRRGALLGRIAWTSPITAPALLGVAAERAAGPEVDAALEEGYALWRRLAAVGRTGHVGQVGENAGGAVVLEPAGPSPQPYPLPLPGRPALPADDVLAAMATAAESAGDAGEAVLLPSDVVEALEKRVEAASRRVSRLRAELEETPDPAATRAVGDLLLARFGEVPKGAGSVRLEGFDGEPVDVELDPSLPVHENAERWYDRAARAERARERLPALIDDARTREAELSALLARVRSGEADPEEVRAELPERTGRGEDTGAGDSLPYRRYRSSGGLEIRVGRGSRRNDDLTFHHSSPDDVWLHARHAAGAHVILRWTGEGSPPPRDLAEAATLAALHSRARTSGSVPVDWTRRKYVRKPRKAPPGAVLPDRVSTVFVEPDEAVEERLRES